MRPPKRRPVYVGTSIRNNRFIEEDSEKDLHIDTLVSLRIAKKKRITKNWVFRLYEAGK